MYKFFHENQTYIHKGAEDDAKHAKALRKIAKEADYEDTVADLKTEKLKQKAKKKAKSSKAFFLQMQKFFNNCNNKKVDDEDDDDEDEEEDEEEEEEDEEEDEDEDEDLF